MKKEIVEIVAKRFQDDVNNIEYQLRRNKNDIKLLAKKQRELKDTRKALYEILRMIKPKQ